jgi:hypothetical protein
MNCKELMTPNPKVCTPSMTSEAAARINNSAKSGDLARILSPPLRCRAFAPTLHICHRFLSLKYKFDLTSNAS